MVLMKFPLQCSSKINHRYHLAARGSRFRAGRVGGRDRKGGIRATALSLLVL
ncbi:hypothetical protein HanPI659440_Chr11g0440981 [Helianthus annuus]|nr:hypothetical protein HanPI659440_Chr11g0440981 [Helianthus annuus]